MGQGTSIETDARLKAMVSKLSKLEIKDIEAVFMELSIQTEEGQFVIQQPSWLNRHKFAEIFGLTDLVVEQLFEAFDRDKNGIIDLQEFVTGMALCLHGGVKEKCHLLFKIFNLDGDEGVSREELSTVLTSCLTSANTLLQSTLKSEGLEGFESQLADQTGAAVMVNVVVDKIVKEAFEICDVSKTGKLEIEEFARWIHKNPKLMNNVFVLQCPKPTTSRQQSESGQSDFSILTMADEGVKDVEPTANNIEIARSVSEISSTSNASTLLELSQDHSKVNQPATASDLFKNNTSSEGAEFFDSLGSQRLTGGDQDAGNKDLTRPASELFLSTPNIIDNAHLQHSTSQNDLNTLQQQEAARNSLLMHQHTQLQNTDSMQSITLSQDSLLETRVEPSGLSNSNENILNEFEQENAQITNATVENTTSHLAQQQTQYSSPQPVVQTSPDHSQSFDNPALSLPTEPKLITPEQPAVIQNNFFAKLSQQISEEHDPVIEMRRRGYSFWEPSKKTAHLLHNNSNQDINSIDTSLLTSPSVLVETPMGDPVKDLVKKYLGEQEASKRPTLSTNHVEMSEKGLKKLLASGCWRAGLDFTTKYLTAHGQGLVTGSQVQRVSLSPGLLQIWFVRIALLYKLRMFSSAEAELNAFRDFDAPDLYYQYYPDTYGAKSGSIVPFSLRLIHAELPQHNGRPNLALDRLYALLEKVQSVLENLEKGLTEDGKDVTEQQNNDQTVDLLKLWRSRKIRLHYAIGNCFLTMKEYTLAIQLYQDCAKLEPERKASIISGIGRIYLQLGDLKSAQHYFLEVEQVVKNEKKKQIHDDLITMNRGYLALSKGTYQEAYQNFANTMKNSPENFAAYNNTAVCLLFLGKMKEASNILENMVWRSPDHCLHEDILFNINTVYELETSRALQKKHKLLDLVCQHKGDGFNTQCLKLS